ncbi:MAG: hypothetical protein A2145_03575 [candidate division Zixibacteria bacterium RBG_16_40_9]|nr:MAG: hypothetical protein A2145_03575 [candidate division Zixibacteria bacterium RBG_16_40_9]
MSSKEKTLWFESHQQDWIPNSLKTIQLDGIFHISAFINSNQKFLTLFKEWQKKLRTKQLVDLGSGSGNLIKYIFENNQGYFSDLHFTLTDWEPQIKLFQRLKNKFPQNIGYLTQKVDIADAPEVIKNKAVTILTSFHELPKNKAFKTIFNLFNYSAGFFIYEPLNRNWFQLVKIPGIFLASLILPFKMKPWRWQNFFFSWLIPLVPFFHLHDSWVSFLRSYTVKDFRLWLEKLGNKDWDWVVDTIGRDITYVLAWRKDES